MINIHKQPNTEYEVGTQILFNVEQGPETPLELVLSGLEHAIDHIKLEARMVCYDALHGTHYRQARHKIKADERNQRFEESIGLERIK